MYGSVEQAFVRRASLKTAAKEANRREDDVCCTIQSSVINEVYSLDTAFVHILDI